MTSRFPAAVLLVLVASATSAGEPAAFGGTLPTTSGDSGLLRLTGAYVLAPGRFSAQLFHDERRQRIGEDVDLDGIAGAFGATDRLEVFARLAVDRYHDDTEVRAGLKWQLRDDRAGDGMAVAVRSEVGHGDGPGARVEGVLSNWHYAGVASHAVLGVARLGDDAGNAFTWGAGLQWQVARLVDIEGEITGERRFEKGPRSPVDATVGVTVALPRRAFVRAGLTQALRAPYGGGFRNGTAVHVSVGLHPGLGPARRVEAP